MTRRTRVVGSIVALAALGSLLNFVTPASAHHIREGNVRFKVTCNFSHSLNDDPIVYPSEPGRSHLHDFLGRQTVDASTTSFGQLVDGDDRTRCNDREDLSAYWVPALYADGGKVDPVGMSAYYRRGRKHGDIQPYPDGLKIVSDKGGWQCDAAVQTSPAGCTRELKMHVDFPDCWDGRNLDSLDHRSHMAYSVDSGGAHTCPRTHPVPVPRLTMYVNYVLPAGSESVTLASGAAAGRDETVHGDFFNGWVRARQLERVETCLNQLQRCDSGG